MATETLKFKLELFATYWDKPPIADIRINEKTYVKKEFWNTTECPERLERCSTDIYHAKCRFRRPNYKTDDR